MRRAVDRWWPVAVAALLSCSAAASAAAGGAADPSAVDDREQRRLPVQGVTGPGEIGGLISIPGNPLPPLPRESVKDAIPIYEGMLSMLRLVLPASAHARGVGYLATLYAGLGDVDKSEELFGDAQRALEREGATGRDLGWVHSNRGLARQQQGRHAEAASSFRAALAALTPVRSELREPLAIVQQNLATSYTWLGDFEASEAAFLAARDALASIGKERDESFQTTSHNLAGLYLMMADFDAARGILEGLLAQGGASRRLRFAILNDLGMALSSLRDFTAAEARLEQAEALFPSACGERVLVLTNLAVVHGQAGDSDQAWREGNEARDLAVRVYGPASEEVGTVEATLGKIALERGQLADAERLLTSARARIDRGSRHSTGALAGLDKELAIVADRRGDRPRAVALARKGFELQAEELEQILSFGSDIQRLAYQRNAYPYDHLANLGEPTLLAEAVLRTKGAVLDSLLVERALVRRSTRPADRERLDRIHALRMAAMEQTARGERQGPGSGPTAVESLLKQEETALAKSLALPVREQRRARPDLAKVQAAMAADEVLVELVRYQLFTPSGQLVPRYGAVIVPPHGCPTWDDLGEVAVIDPAIKALLARLDRGQRGTVPLGSGRPDEEVSGDLRRLHDQLWGPLVAAFPAATRTVVLSPDGELHFVPWAALLDERGTLLAERWRLLQVGSGRDLLRPQGEPSERSVLAFADGTNDLGYAQVEVATVDRLAKTAGWRSSVFVGDAATEAELARHPNPGILHLATHGGELDGEKAAAVGARLGREPMYRGFLLLGGADGTLAAWRRGVVVPPEGDGILTAEEIGGLDLGRTWVTVLAACHSGSGEARSGEGVLGLRRGVALAGSRYLLFSLWSIDDEATAAFMEAFYQRLFDGGEPEEAFIDSQREQLQQVRRQSGLAAAVFRAAGLVLTR